MTNTRWVVKQGGEEEQEPQTEGTLIELNIHEPHGMFEYEQEDFPFQDQPVDGASFLLFQSETKLEPSDVAAQFQNKIERLMENSFEISV